MFLIKFSGDDEDEDVEDFVDGCFEPEEVYFRETDRETARLLFLASMLDGKAERSIEKSKGDTWEETTALGLLQNWG